MSPPPLLLGAAGTEDRARGLAQGEHWRASIARGVALARAGLAALGVDFVVLAGWLGGLGRRLAELEPGAAAELSGIAAAGGVELDDLLVLEAFDAILDLVDAPGGPADASFLYVPSEAGPALGACWARLRGEADETTCLAWTAPGLGSVAVALRPGTLGFAGLSNAGLAAVTIALPRRDPGPGLSAGALLRRVLRARRVAEAQVLLGRGLVASGCFVGLGDPRSYAGYELSPELVIRTQVGPATAHVHAAAAFDPVVRRAERPRAGAPAFLHLERLTTRYAQRRPVGRAATCRFLAELTDDRGAQAATAVVTPVERTLWLRAPSGATTELRLTELK